MRNIFLEPKLTTLKSLLAAPFIIFFYMDLLFDTCTYMEEPEAQCTVVFTLIVTKPASECIASSVTIQAKTAVHYSPDSFMPTPQQPPSLPALVKHKPRLLVYSRTTRLLPRRANNLATPHRA
jgi:hypothetical protein